MGLSDAVAAALGKYAVFQGRALRPEYWWFALFTLGSNFVASTLDGFTGLPIFGLVVGLGLFVPSLAVAVRRLHDVNLSGWWMLVPVLGITLAAIIGAVLLPMAAGGGAVAAAVVLAVFVGMVVVFARPGTAGPNRFGADPRAGGLTGRPAGTAGGNSRS